ncbi:MAG: hypothetical protein NTAFB05_09750 [Nitrobacter sp.]|uniref:hypothetical protein n=1 Tax=Nitrobacter sp. TaxID=29420 RepID=UPI00387DE26C
MNWDWTSPDQFWHSSTFPFWLTLVVAGFFAILVLVTLVRADKSVANVVLTVITLLAIGVAAAVTTRGFSPEGRQALESKNLYAPDKVAAMPALSCIDDLAGDVVEAACEKALFGTPDAVAAAVSYTASEISRVRSFNGAADAGSVVSVELAALRRALERDRYGLVAHVLTVRDHCRPSDCAAFQSLTDHSHVAANMEEGTYEKLVTRYAPSWSAPAARADAAEPETPPLPALASEPTGKPTTADFPTAASIPPVSIMTPEPPTGAAPPPSPPTPPSATAQAVPKPGPTRARKHTTAPRAAPKAAPRAHAEAPVRLTPEPSAASTQD